jgi:glycosyltransferase involved in cell wall biosynthesis
VLTVDAVISARDEELTVSTNVAAARACPYVREVIVVDDGSTDATAARAVEAGAKVISLPSSAGSKAHAMRAGVEASDAQAILFVDADCIGLTGEHLARICEPVLEGRAVLSLGAFDYGRFWNPFVLRWPPLTGERIVPRWVFESIPEDKLDGYTIEVRINEVVAEGHLPTVARTMDGVFHRTKRVKQGRWQGVLATLTMYRALLAMVKPIGDVRLRTYVFYLRHLTVER